MQPHLENYFLASTYTWLLYVITLTRLSYHGDNTLNLRIICKNNMTMSNLKFYVYCDDLTIVMFQYHMYMCAKGAALVNSPTLVQCIPVEVLVLWMLKGPAVSPTCCGLEQSSLKLWSSPLDHVLNSASLRQTAATPTNQRRFAQWLATKLYARVQQSIVRGTVLYAFVHHSWQIV